MKEYVTYIHGSEDSTDVDIFYVFDELPSKQECKKFCSADPSENRNIIVIKDGVVTACYKGTPDEVNNSLIDTYDLHEQKFPLLITKRVDRDLTIKVVRAIRIILSHLSRSKYRNVVKQALVSDFLYRLDILRYINLAEIDFSVLNKNMSREDILKTIAFQIGQTSDLFFNIEVYTKSEVALDFPALEEFLYRDKNSDIHVLEKVKNDFLDLVEKKLKCDRLIVTDGYTTYNCKTEEKVD